MIDIKLDTHAVRQLFPEGTTARSQLQQSVISNIAKDLIVKDTGNKVRKLIQDEINAYGLVVPDVSTAVQKEVEAWFSRRGYGAPYETSEVLKGRLREAADREARNAVDAIISDVIKTATDKAMKDIEYKIEYATRRIEKVIVDRVNQNFASIIDQAVAEKIKKAFPGL